MSSLRRHKGSAPIYMAQSDEQKALKREMRILAKHEYAVSDFPFEFVNTESEKSMAKMKKMKGMEKYKDTIFYALPTIAEIQAMNRRVEERTRDGTMPRRQPNRDLPRILYTDYDGIDVNDPRHYQELPSLEHLHEISDEQRELLEYYARKRKAALEQKNDELQEKEDEDVEEGPSEKRTKIE